MTRRARRRRPPSTLTVSGAACRQAAEALRVGLNDQRGRPVGDARELTMLERFLAAGQPVTIALAASVDGSNVVLPEPEWVTIVEALAELAQPGGVVTPRAVRQWAARGEPDGIPARKAGRVWLVRTSDVARNINDRTTR